MDNKQALFEQIEAYLNGHLAADEAEQFSQKIARDPMLAQLVQQHQLERMVLKAGAQETLHERMKQWDEELANKPNHARLWWLLLLIPLTIAIVYWSQLPTNTSPSKERPDTLENPVEDQNDNSVDIPSKEEAPEAPTLPPVAENENSSTPQDYLALAIDRHALPQQLQTAVRDAAPIESDTTMTALGIKSYNNGNWEQAISHFNSALLNAAIEDKTYLQEWLAHSYFKNKQYDKAAQLFEELTKNGSNQIRSRAEWYFLLALLPDHDRHQETINNLLDKISAPDSYHNYRDLVLDLQRSM